MHTQEPLYRGLVIRAANWLLSYRDERGLPQPSWDLWEERRGVSAWTVGATWAGLQSAAYFTEAFGEFDLAESYQQAAEQMRAAAQTHFWQPELQRYSRLLLADEDGNLHNDNTRDSSLTGLWMFGMLDPADDRIISTMLDLHEHLWVNTEIGGMARYENDTYYQASQDTKLVPGNPWFICTLWLARWYSETAKSADDLLRQHNCSIGHARMLYRVGCFRNNCIPSPVNYFLSRPSPGVTRNMYWPCFPISKQNNE